MASFVLTAKLVLLPPSNVEDIVRLLNAKLANIKTRVDITVPAKTLNHLDKLSAKIRQTEESIAAASSKMNGFNASIQRAAQSSFKLANASGGGKAGSRQGQSPFIASQPVNLGKSIGEINTLSASTARLAKSTKAATDEFDKFGHQAAISLRRFGAFTLAAGTFIKLSQAITAGVGHAVAYDLQMTKLSQVLGSSRDGVKNLDAEITRLSTNLGVSSSKLADVALTLAQAGLSATNTKIALEVLAQTELAPTFENITNTGEAAIAVLAQFGGQAKDLSKDFSEINTIAAKFAVESSDLTTAISKTGGVFAASGGSLRELLALFTSVRSTTRESADSIATGFRTIFARLQRPQTQSFLKTIGVELRDLEGQFVGPYEAIRRISTALKDVPATSPLFAKAIEEIGGYRQISRVIPLIQQFNVAEQARIAALSASGSLTEDSIKAQESFANKLSKVREEYLATMRAFSQDDSIKGAIDSLLKLASAFNQVLATIKPLAPALALLGLQSLIPGAVRGFRAFTKGPEAKFATGGVVPGHGDGDSVNAMLTPGEFVIKKKSAQAIGYKNLHEMNRYATGGRVKMSKGGGFMHSPESISGLASIVSPSGGVGFKESEELTILGMLTGKHSLKKGFDAYSGARNIIKKSLGLDPKNHVKNIIGLSHPRFATNDKMSLSGANGLHSSISGNVYYDTDFVNASHLNGIDVMLEELLHGVDHSFIGRPKEYGSTTFGTPHAKIANMASYHDMKAIARVEGVKPSQFFGPAEAYYTHPTEKFAKTVKMAINPETSGQFESIFGSKSSGIRELMKSLAPKKYKFGGRAEMEAETKRARERLRSIFGVDPMEFLEGGISYHKQLIHPSGKEVYGAFFKDKKKIALSAESSRKTIYEELLHAMDFSLGHGGKFSSEGRSASKKQNIGGHDVSGKVRKNPAAEIAKLYSDKSGIGILSALENVESGDHAGLAYISKKQEVFAKTVAHVLTGNRRAIRKADPEKYEELMRILPYLGDRIMGDSPDSIRPSVPLGKFRKSKIRDEEGFNARIQEIFAPKPKVRTRSSKISLTSGFGDISGKDWLKTIGIAGGGTLAAVGGIAALLSVLKGVHNEYQDQRLHGVYLDRQFANTRGYNSGGNVVGGSGDRDTIPAMLTPGEFVFNKKSAQAIGYDKLHNMNKYARFATGGKVGGSMLGGGLSSAALGAAYVLPAVSGWANDTIKSATGLENAFDNLTQIILTSVVGFAIMKKALGGLTNYQDNSNTQKYKQNENSKSNGFRVFSSDRTTAITGNIRLKSLRSAAMNRENDLEFERRAELSNRKKDISAKISVLDDARRMGKNGLGYPNSAVNPKSPQQIKLEQELASARLVAPGEEEKKAARIRERTTSALSSPKSRFSDSRLAEQNALHKSATASAASIDKWNSRLNTTAIALAALSIASVELGSYFHGLSSKQYEAGDVAGARESAGRAGAFTSMGTYASIGGSIGGVVGGVAGGALTKNPYGVAAGTSIGTGVGSTIGLGVGYVTGSYSAEKKFDEMVKVDNFNKEGERLGRTAAFDIDRMNFDQSKSTKSTGALVALRKQQFDSATDKSTAKQAIGQDLGNIDVYLQKSAGEFAKSAKETGDSTKALAGFKKETEDVRKFYAKFTNSTLADVDDRFKAIIEDATNIVAANEQLIKSSNELATRMERISLIIGAIAAVTDSLHQFEAAIKGASERAFGLSGGTDYQDSQILQNPDTVTNFAEFERRTKSVGSVFGSAGDEAAATAVAGTKIFNQLPSLLSGAASAGLLNNDDDTRKLLEDKFGKDNPQVDAIIKDLNAKLNQGGNRDQSLDELKRDPRAFSSAISGGAEALIKPFQAAESAINRELTKYSQGLAVRRQIEYKYIDMLNGIIDMRNQKEIDLAEAQERDIDFSKLYAGIESQLQNILPNVKGGKAQSLDEIEKDLKSSKESVKGVDSRLASGVNYDGTSLSAIDKRNLEKGKDASLERYERNKKALEFIGSGKGIDAIKSELGRERGRRNTVKDYFKEYAFSDNAGRRDSIRGLRAAKTIAMTGSANSVSGENRQRASGVLDRFNDVRLDAFGGKTGKEVKDAATANEMRNQGFSEADIKSVITATPKEEKLIAALEGAYDAAEKANKILADDLKENQKTLVQNLDDSFKKFLDELRNIFLDKEAEENGRKQDTNKNEQDKNVDELGKRTKVTVRDNGKSRYATDDEIASMQRTKGARKQLEQLDKDAKSGDMIAKDLEAAFAAENGLRQHDSMISGQQYKDFLGEEEYDKLFSDNKDGTVSYDKGRVKDAVEKKRKAIADRKEKIRDENSEEFVQFDEFREGTDVDKYYKDNGIDDVDLSRGSTAELRKRQEELKKQQKKLEEEAKGIEGKRDTTLTPDAPEAVTPDIGDRLPGVSGGPMNQPSEFDAEEARRRHERNMGKHRRNNMPKAAERERRRYEKELQENQTTAPNKSGTGIVPDFIEAINPPKFDPDPRKRRKAYEDKATGRGPVFGGGFGSVQDSDMSGRMVRGRKPNGEEKDSAGPMAGFDKSISNFLASAGTLGEAMNNFPRSVTIEGNIKVEAIVNGAAVLQEIQPGIAKLVAQAVNNAMGIKAKQDKVS